MRKVCASARLDHQGERRALGWAIQASCLAAESGHAPNGLKRDGRGSACRTGVRTGRAMTGSQRVSRTGCCACAACWIRRHAPGRGARPVMGRRTTRPAGTDRPGVRQRTAQAIGDAAGFDKVLASVSASIDPRIECRAQADAQASLVDARADVEASASVGSTRAPSAISESVAHAESDVPFLETERHE